MTTTRKTIAVGTSVSYTDMANPTRSGQVCDRYPVMLATYHGNGTKSERPSGDFSYEIAWADGTFSTSDLRQAGWKIEAQS